MILTLLTVWFTFGILTAVWVIIDAFLIPGWVREDRKVRQNAMQEIKLMKTIKNNKKNFYIISIEIVFLLS